MPGAGCPHFWLVDPSVPSIVAFTLVGRRYEHVDQAQGAAVLVVDEPFAVRVVPDELVEGAPERDDGPYLK